MKIIHCLSIGGFIVAIGLFFAGFSNIAGFLLGLITVIELAAATAMGKQTKAGKD